MKVFQVITDTDRRGGQLFAMDLQAALRERGVTVGTAALAPGVVGGLDLPVLGPTRRHATAGLNLRRAGERADVVIAHGSTTLLMCALWLAGSRTPFLYRQISDSLYWAPSRVVRGRVAFLMSRARRIVALWSGARDVLVEHFGVRRERIAIVPNGVPRTRFPDVTAADRRRARDRLGIDHRVPVVAYGGALVPEKGVDLAIRAVAALETPQLVVAGDGPQSGALRSLGADLLGDRVLFCGQLPDPRELYAAADVLVLPSRGGDSMPAVLIEAALSGVPCVATPIAAIPQMLGSGAGVLVHTDDPGGLARGIGQLLQDRVRRTVVIRTARQRALERYEMGPVADGYIDVLNGVVPDGRL